MEIVITHGTNAKSQRCTRIRVEITDKDLATIEHDPEKFLKVIERSREKPHVRLNELARLGFLIETAKAADAAPAKAKKK